MAEQHSACGGRRAAWVDGGVLAALAGWLLWLLWPQPAGEERSTRWRREPPAASALAVASKESPARLELEICNRTQEPRVYAAIASYDPALGRLVARGWFPQAAGRCQRVLRNLTPPIYVLGESRDGRQRWPAKAIRDDAAFSARPQFCLPGAAAFVVAEGGCVDGMRAFSAIAVEPGAAVLTWSIEDAPVSH